MIIDTEPIRFYYNHKNWLITFWKGQYGIVTGAEIGVYCTKQQKVNKATIYFPVSNEEMLDMEFTLYRKNRKIATVKEKHWWLVIFKLGMFSWPKNLSMDIMITFPNVLMLKSFLDSFIQLGYTTKDFKIKDRTFSFYFTKPHTKQVNTRIWYKDWIRQFYNYKNVVLYNKTFLQLTDNNKIDDSKTSVKDNVIMINELLPSFIKNQSSKDKKSKRWIRKIGKVLEEKILSLENDSPVKENDDE